MAGTSSPDPCSAPFTDEHAARWANRQLPSERAALVDAYTPLVRRMAARCYARRVGGELEFADLVQLGMVGLLEAIDRYSPALGVRFETFAGYRIEGAILNGLASYSEVQSLLATRREQMANRSRSLREQSEVADAQAPQDALTRLIDLAIGLALGFMLEDPSDDEREEPAQPDNAYERHELSRLRRELAAMVQHLPVMERKVVWRHYYQQQAFNEVAEGLGLTPGRISQIHKAALGNLRQMAKSVNGFEVRA